MRHVTAHRMIAHVAEEMAATVYEELAKADWWYRLNPGRAAFVKKCAPTLRMDARRTLGELLQQAGTSEAEKRDIYEALLADNSLPRGGASIRH